MWHTWFDRDLTIAGRMIIRKGKDDSVSYSHQLVRIEQPIIRIPTLAIHLDRYSFIRRLLSITITYDVFSFKNLVGLCSYVLLPFVGQRH